MPRCSFLLLPPVVGMQRSCYSCCCAGFGAAGGAAAGAEAAEGDTGAAEAAGAGAGVCGALFACVERLAGSIIALVYCAFTGLFRAPLVSSRISERV